MLFLPRDPNSDVVTLDQETLTWLTEVTRVLEGRRRFWFNRERATSNALVRYDVQGEGFWTRYLALYRHGGIEVGADHVTYHTRDVRFFLLRSLVGLAWIAANVQFKATDRWQIQTPFELTLALRTTTNAALGDFAEGWSDPEWIDETPTSLEDNVLLRFELEDGIDVEECVTDLGDRVEQAFGSVSRRHIARVGEYEGRLDPRGR
jgi:hypothetical protein